MKEMYKDQFAKAQQGMLVIPFDSKHAALCGKLPAIVDLIIRRHQIWARYH